VTHGQAICYLIAIILLVLATVGVRHDRINVAFAAAAFALLGYALPGLQNLFGA
jgi:hypothetical protein